MTANAPLAFVKSIFMYAKYVSTIHVGNEEAATPKSRAYIFSLLRHL